jgi:thioredoxin reductase
MVEIAIIGAGPYGLSIAAYLKARGLGYRIFGRPMDTWQTHMPKGMRLKSEGFASSLYDPGSTFTLANYCKKEGLPYADLGLPVPLETFVSYGLEFQKRFVPELEDSRIVSLRNSSNGFQISLESGEVVSARKVVTAAGLCYFEQIPPVLSVLSEQFVTHSSRHCTLDRFKGREVAVVGAGASALDLAALLYQAGASVHLVARKAVIKFHTQGKTPRPLWEQTRNPTTGIGPGWRSLFCTRAPHLFHRLPERFRLDFVQKHLGPAPAWFIRDQVVGKIPFLLGVTITGANVQGDRVSLQLTNQAGDCQTLVTEHVIAATGYKVDLRRLTFLDNKVRAEIRSVDQTPVLSSNFESSVPGLYFVGASSANSFGPLMRFAFGARFTAHRLSKHLSASLAR